MAILDVLAVRIHEELQKWIVFCESSKGECDGTALNELVLKKLTCDVSLKTTRKLGALEAVGEYAELEA